MRTHQVKSWPVRFAAIEAGTATFDLRRDDRGYAVGDCLSLMEFDPAPSVFTGRKLERRIVHLERGGGVDMTRTGLLDGFVALGLAPMQEDER